MKEKTQIIELIVFYYALIHNVQDLIKEINNLRKNPVSFADKILSYKRYFKEEKVIKLPGEKFGIQLEEGFPAYKEAAQYLNSLTPVGEMTASKGLIRIAKDYLEECKDCDPEEIGNIEINENRGGGLFGFGRR